MRDGFLFRDCGGGIFSEIEGFSDDLIHVEVTIGAEATDRGDVWDCRKLVGVARVESQVSGQTLGVIRDLGWLGFLAKFAEGDGAFQVLPRSEVFVLVDACPRSLFTGVIDHRVALKIPGCVDALEMNRAIAEGAGRGGKKLIEGAAIKDVIEFCGHRGFPAGV